MLDESKKGYLYFRENELTRLPQYNAVKIGITDSPVDRESGYITSEIKLGEFTKVFEIPHDKQRLIELIVHNYFKSSHIYIDAGTEYFKISVKNEINELLNKLSCEIRELSKDEIKELNRKLRLKSVINKFKNTRLPKLIKDKVKRKNKKIVKLKFRKFQNACISIFKSKIKNNKSYNGLFIAPTGWGKSFINKCFMNIFLSEKTEGNILFITKRLDLLNDFTSGLANDILDINYSRLGNTTTSNLKFNIINIFKGEKVNTQLDCNKRNIYIINIDKLDSFGLENKINDLNIKLCLIDEVQWVSGEKTKEHFQTINDNVNYVIGCSATPMRDNFNKQQALIKLFKKETVGEKDKYNIEDLEIMFQLSYQECWDEGIILQPSIQYFNVDMIEDNINHHNGWVLSDKAYLDYLNQVNDLWQNLVYHKGIMYFPTRLELIKFLIWCQSRCDIPIIKDCLDRIYYSFTPSKYKENKEDCETCKKNDTLIGDARCSDCMVANLYQKFKEGETKQFQELSTDFKRFKNHNEYALLLVVDRAKEGFDDKRVEMAINMNFVKSRCLLQTLQIIGRVQRIDNDKQKKDVYYVNPVPNIEDCHELIIKGLADYILAVFKDKDIEGIRNNAKKRDTIEVLIGDNKLISSDDIYKQVSDMVKRNNIINLNKLICILKNNNIYNMSNYNDFKKQDEFNNLPDNPFTIKGFKWELLNNMYYTRHECINAIINIIHNNIKEFRKIKKLRKNKEVELNLLDSRIPPQYLVNYYGGNRKEFKIYI